MTRFGYLPKFHQYQELDKLMKLNNFFWSLLFLLYVLSGCAGSPPAGDAQPPAELPPAQEAVEAHEAPSPSVQQKSAPASESSAVSVKKTFPAERSEQKRKSGEAPAPVISDLPEGSNEEAFEREDEESAGLGLVTEHPFRVTKTATTSETAALNAHSGKGAREPMVHTYTPTGTATVSGSSLSVAGGTLERVKQPGLGAASASSSAQGDAITLNGDDLDIHEIIHKVVGPFLGLNYVVDPRVTGKVNIRSNRKIAKEDLFSVFETLLRVNNATIIRKGELFHIVPLATTKQEPLIPYRIPPKDIPDEDRYLMQIVILDHISAEEIAKILKPFLSPQGADIIAQDTVLILLDFASNIRKLMSLIDLFDVGMFERLHVQLYEANYVDVEDLASELDDVFQAFELPANTARAGGITFVPITRLNMLMAVSANELLLEKAIQWVERMDTEISETALKIFVYYVQNSKAQEINDVLTQVFTGETPKKETAFKSKLRETKTPKGKQPKKTPTPARVRKSRESSEEVTGEVEFVVDERNNALIVKCSERDYRTILKTIKKLDIYPKQVLIEVLIAEIRLDDELEMGVEWKYMNRADEADYTVTSSGAPEGYGKLGEEIVSGLAANIIKTDRLIADLKAYAAEDKVNILSSPHVIASDNQEATINVTEEIPVVSATIESAENPLVTNSVEYRDTGIILKVTPHINDKGLVSLEVSQEVSQQSEKAATGTENPIFLKRSAETTMVVQNGQTVIIGGLIRETWSEGRAGVPYLSEIPMLGVLFGFDRKVKNRAELMFLLTPHVITSIEQADTITKEFKSKLSILKKEEQEFNAARD